MPVSNDICEACRRVPKWLEMGTLQGPIALCKPCFRLEIGFAAAVNALRSQPTITSPQERALKRLLKQMKRAWRVDTAPYQEELMALGIKL